MTKERAEYLYRRQRDNDFDRWFNEPYNWPERDRPLTPAELIYAQAALNA